MIEISLISNKLGLNLQNNILNKSENKDQNGNKTLTPSRRSTDERRQFSIISNKITNASFLSKNSLYLYEGNIFGKDKVAIKNSGIYGNFKRDIDAIEYTDNTTFPISCRYISVDGGSQYKSFQDLFLWINQCPQINQNSNVCPIILYGGNYFNKIRKEFQGYEFNYDLPNTFTTIDVLKTYIKNKEKLCLCLSEKELAELNITSFKDLIIREN